MNSIEVLNSKALIDSVIRHDEFVLINNFLKTYNKMTEKLKVFIICKYVWCNKRNINTRKRVYWN